MAKQVSVEIEVNSSQVDQTVQKLGELKDLGKGLKIQYDIDGKPIDLVIDKTLNLQKQAKILTAELRKTKEGTAEFQLLSARLGDVQDSLDRTKIKSGDLFTTLQLLPGPIGQFASQVNGAISALKVFSSFSLKDLKFQFKETIDDFKNIVSAIGKATGITKIYTTLNNFLATSFVKVGVAEGAAAAGARAFAAALTATGVGALIVGLGLLINALTNLVSGEKEAEAANDRLAESFRMLKKSADDSQEAIKNKTEIDLIYAKSANKSEEELTKIRQKGLDDRKVANEKAIKDNLSAVLRNQADVKITDEQRKKNDDELNAEKIRLNGVANSLIFEQNKSTAEDTLRIETKKREDLKKIGDKRVSDNKSAQDKIIQDTKTYYDKLNTVENENEILKSKSSYERAYLKIVQDTKIEEEEINKLKLKDERINGVLVTGEQKRLKLINAVRTNANLKLSQLTEEFDIKLLENSIKSKDAEIELQNLIIEKKIGMIKDEYSREEAILNNAAINEKIKVEESIASTERKAQAIKTIEEKLAFDIQKLKDDTVKKESQTNLEKLDNDLKFLQIRQEAIQEGTIGFYDAQRDILYKSFERELAAIDDKLLNENIKQEDAEKEKLALKEKYSKMKDEISKKEVETYLSYVSAGLSAASNFISQQQQINSLAMANELAEVKGNAEAEDKIKEKYFYKNKDAQIGQAVISTLQSAISAYSSLAVIPVVGPALGAIAAAAALVFGYKQVALMKAQKYQSGLPTAGGGGEAAKPAMANYGQNYESGGLIGGRRHAQGGTLIEAEKGEAIMTRGAVTMFAPLLSTLNQMGGGTSFSKGASGQAGYDNPIVTQPSQEQSPIIVKSYVVSSDMTSAQEKNARLKDLSTL